MPLFISSTESDKCILDCCSLAKLFVLFSDLGILRQTLNASFATRIDRQFTDSFDFFRKVLDLSTVGNIFYHPIVVAEFAIFNGTATVLFQGHVILIYIQRFILICAPRRLVVKPTKKL